MLYYFDWYGMIFMLPFLLFALWCSYNVKSTFQKYSQTRSSRGLTGAKAAQELLQQNGVYDVRIEHISGKLNDHFDPRTKVIRLSDDVYDSTSIAAIGVACHEAGHAVQHATGYTPLKLRNAVIPITNIGSQFGIFGVLIGFLLSADWLVTISLVLFFFTVLFQLLTLPTELNASKRAIQTLESTGMLYGDEVTGARKVLNAAALTYVAALATAIAQFVRVLLYANNRRR